MAKKKKKKNPQAQAPSLVQVLAAYFAANPTSRLDAKQLIQKLKLSQNKDAVQAALEQLAQQGLVVQLPAGNKYRWNRQAGAPAAEYLQNAPIKSETRVEEPKQPKQNSERQTAEGLVDMTRFGAAYIVVPDLQNDIYVPPHKTANALNGDTVAVRWWKTSRGKMEGEIIGVIRRQTEDFIGTLVLSRQHGFVIPDDLKMPTDIAIDRKNLRGAIDGEKVLVRIRRWHHNNHGHQSPFGEIILVLGKAGSSDIEMQSILLQNGFNLLFPPEVLKENEEIKEEIPQEEIQRRRDFRNTLTFTIDPETAKDFDDALSVRQLENGNYEIGVHIADVGYYVKPGSALDKEAIRRTTSVYLVDRVLPMLPEKLSNGVCSLRPKEDKLTFSAVFEMTLGGKIVSEWFGKTIIHSDRRFTYEEAQEILETGEGDHAEELKVLNTIAHKLREERFRAGSINFETPEVRFVLDEKGRPLSVYLKLRKDAHMLVEDFMLLANRRTAALIAHAPQKGQPAVPFVYRVHDLPDMEKVANFAKFAHALGYSVKANSPNQVSRAFSALLKKAEGKPESAILQQLAIRTMAKAAYTTDNIGHYGLGFETYTHFTSPIRRYADVLSHRILWDYLQGRNAFSVKPQELEELCVHISRKERKAMEAERESIKYKQAEFLVEHIGSIFQGVISGIAEHGIYVELKDNFCEGMVRYDNMYDNFQMINNFMIHSKWQDYKMGDLVWVRILNAEPQRRQIDMELLDPKGAEVKEQLQSQGIEMPMEQPNGKLKTGGTVLPNTHLMELDLPMVEEEEALVKKSKKNQNQNQNQKQSQNQGNKKPKKQEPKAEAKIEAPVQPKAEETPAPPAKPKRSTKASPKVEAPVQPKAEEMPAPPTKPKRSTKASPKVEEPVQPKAEETPAPPAKPKRSRTKKDQPPTA